MTIIVFPDSKVKILPPPRPLGLATRTRYVGVCIAYLTVTLMGSIAAYTCHAQELDESWLLRKRSDIVVDGNDADWEKCGYTIDGQDTIAEKNCVVTLQRGWNSDGLLCAINIITDVAKWDAGATIDFFADLRAPESNMAAYEPGVSRVSLSVTATRVSATIKCGTMEERSVQVGRELQAKVSKNSDGWFVEVLIPWATLGGQRPQLEDWIGFCTRVRLLTAGGTSLILGADTEEERNPIETTPIAFTPVRLAPEHESPTPNISFKAAEIILGTAPWLQIKATALKSRMNLEGAMMEINSPALGHIEEPFETSAGEKCWVFDFKRALPFSFSPEEVVCFTIHTARETISWRQAIATPALQRWRLTESTIPDELLAGLPDSQRALGHLLKDCAKECALLLSPNINDGRSVRKRARAILFPGIYEDRIRRFERIALRLAHDEHFADMFPYRTWRSRIDGEWLPYKLIRPWNAGTQPVVQLTLNGAKLHHSRAEMLESDVIALDNNYIPSTYGDYNYVIMYERSAGNRIIDRESLEYFFRHIVPTFGATEPILGIQGVSAGAISALQIALDYPDQFSFIRLASGLIPESASFQAESLKHASISLVVGETDTEVVEANRHFAESLRAKNIPYSFEILPKTGHHFFPPRQSVEQTSKVRPKHPPSVSLETFMPNECDWLKLDQVTIWGKPVSLRGEISPARIDIKVTNAISFKLRPALMPSVPNNIVYINGKEIGSISLEDPDEVTFTLAQDGTYYRAARKRSVGPIKIAGSTGPASEIDCRPVTIVYGTCDIAFNHILRHRATEVIRTHIGFGQRQISASGYTIMSDREALRSDLKGRNIWLIGAPEQNEYALMLNNAGKLPSSLPDISNDPDALLSYIYPLAGEDGGYLFHEVGQTPMAYCSAALAAPNYDICVQTFATDTATVKYAGNFNTVWSFKQKQ